ncbi:MAG: SGNH/GDSL hydrolase family protein [Eubacteriales bacterium]|nr:SGNH/GDSL hydrolase family protein [Eubacteriales bacterium]
MKIRNYLTILFAVVAIIGLAALAGYMTLYIADDSNPLKQQVMQVFHLDAQDDADDSAPETSPETDSASAVKEHSILFVGDSRTLGMKDAVNDNCIYLGAEGEGYEWFTSSGISSMVQILESNPTQQVVFNLGVNDPKNISLYIDTYTSLMNQYPDTPFYLMSVNPLDDKGEYNTTNEMVEIFNATLESSFPDNYLDCYSYMTQNGFETVDGLHYTEDTYRKIHNYVVDKIA